MSNYICEKCGNTVFDKGHNDCYCHYCELEKLKKAKTKNIKKLNELIKYEKNYIKNNEVKKI